MASPVASPTDLIELEDGEVVEGSVQDEIPTQHIYKGPLGARSLVDLSRGKMMRLATRYADIGDLQYAQHELFFKTRPVEQLAELEDNSPGIKVDTDHLWAEFLLKEDPEAHAKNLARPITERKSWRRIYFRTIRRAAEQEQAEWQRIKEEADDEERARKANKLKIIERVIPSTGRRRSGGYRSSGGGTPMKQTSIVDKLRKSSAGRREITRHSSNVTSSTPRRTGDPFRGSTILATAGSSSSAPRMKLPPLPTNQIQQSDNEVPSGYSVMPLVKEPVKPAVPKVDLMEKDQGNEKKRVSDVAFFEDAAGQTTKRKVPNNSIRPKEINVVKTTLLPLVASDPMMRKRSHQDDKFSDVDAPNSRLISTHSIPAPSVVANRTTDTSTPPRPKPAVPLNSLFMPKKKRKP